MSGPNPSLQATAIAPSVLTGPRNLDIIIAAKLSLRWRRLSSGGRRLHTSQ
jgi:hypothetical protein